MKKLFILFILFIPVFINAQDFKVIQDGIEYAEMTRTIENQPVKMNLLRMDLTKVRLDVVHALDNAIGTETVSSMAKRHGAIAAINAGFFRFDGSIFAGDAAGILVINHELYSESYNGRTALEILNLPNKTEVFMEKLNVNQQIVINKKNHMVGINRQRQENDVVIFTRTFNFSTLTNNDGVEFIVRKNRVREVLKGKGSNPIPSDGFVISVSGKQSEEFLALLKKGKKVEKVITNTVTLDGSSPNMFGPAEDIVAGVPQLIKNGKIDITWEQEKTTKAFVETKHPRTAVAKLKDGKFLMITVDGRSVESVGIGLEDLAKILIELGATDAMNLDGGGSTTMFLDGKVVNKPSDKEGERKVSDAILVSPRKRN